MSAAAVSMGDLDLSRAYCAAVAQSDDPCNPFALSQKDEIFETLVRGVLFTSVLSDPTMVNRPQNSHIMPTSSANERRGAICKRVSSGEAISRWAEMAQIEPCGRLGHARCLIVMASLFLCLVDVRPCNG